jgi:uncharacterized protein YegL
VCLKQGRSYIQTTTIPLVSISCLQESHYRVEVVFSKAKYPPTFETRRFFAILCFLKAHIYQKNRLNLELQANYFGIFNRMETWELKIISGSRSENTARCVPPTCKSRLFASKFDLFVKSHFSSLLPSVEVRVRDAFYEQIKFHIRGLGLFLFGYFFLAHGWAGEQDKTAGSELRPKIFFSRDDTIILKSDDTLEFSLQFPAGEVVEGNSKANVAERKFLKPKLAAWLVEPNEPASGLPHGRILLHRAPDADALGSQGWLVHVRGLRAPKNTDSSQSLDLILRWRFSDNENQPENALAGGEVRLPGKVRFVASKPDVVLLLDGSGSMKLNDPNRLRCEAVRTFVALAQRLEGVGRTALIQFDDNVRVILPLTPLAQTADFAKALERIRESGQTDIDGGLKEAFKLLDEGQPGAVVLMSDGKQEPGPYKNSHLAARVLGVPVHTVALGKGADDRTLRRIAQETGGTFWSAASGGELVRLYENIAADLARSQTIYRVRAARPPDAPLIIPIDASCRSLCAEVITAAPHELFLHAPNEPEPRGAGVPLHPVQYRSLPQAGDWTAFWRPVGGTPPAADAPEFRATARTALYPLFFQIPGETQTAQPRSESYAMTLDGGRPNPALSLTEGDLLIATAAVTVSFYAGSHEAAADARPLFTVNLRDDGRSGDGAAGDGVFALDALLSEQRVALKQAQTGWALAIVSGRRTDGQAFRRETEARWRLAPPPPPRLLVSEPLVLGTPFSGEEVVGAFHVRLLGDAEAAVETTVTSAPSAEKLGWEIGFQEVSAPLPASGSLTVKLPPYEQKSFLLRLTVPPEARSGDCAGQIHVKTVGSQELPALSAVIPWRIHVKTPALILTPSRLELGTLPPCAALERTVKIRTAGGSRIISARHLRAVTDENERGRLTSSSDSEKKLIATADERELSLHFAVPVAAAPGPLVGEFLFLDETGETAGILPLAATIASSALTADGAGDLGCFESGEQATGTLTVRWTFPESPTAVIPPGLEKLLREAHLSAAPSSIRGLETSFTPLVAAAPTGVKAKFRIIFPNATNAPRVLDDVPGDVVAGEFSVVAGPMRLNASWSARIVVPDLRLEPQTLDFGNVRPGETAERAVVMTGEATRFLPATTNVGVLKKPLLPHIRLPEDAVEFHWPGKTAGTVGFDLGAVADLPRSLRRQIAGTLRLRVPESAQDGVYAGEITLSGTEKNAEIVRGGSAKLRYVVRVPPEIEGGPPFHLSPAKMILRFLPDKPLPVEKLRITSHRDEDLVLLLEAQAPPPHKDPYAAFLHQGQGDVPNFSLLLPGRSQIEVLVHAREHAQDGDVAQIVVSGANERQTAAVKIERKRVISAGGFSFDESELWRWFTLLFLLLLALLVVLLRALFRRKWVRLTVYTLAFHAAFMPLLVPGTAPAAWLSPEQTKLTLHQWEELFQREMSSAQIRRLAAMETPSTPEMLPELPHEPSLAPPPTPQAVTPPEDLATLPSELFAQPWKPTNAPAPTEEKSVTPTRETAKPSAEKPLSAEPATAMEQPLAETAPTPTPAPLPVLTAFVAEPPTTTVRTPGTSPSPTPLARPAPTPTLTAVVERPAEIAEADKRNDAPTPRAAAAALSARESPLPMETLPQALEIPTAEAAAQAAPPPLTAAPHRADAPTPITAAVAIAQKPTGKPTVSPLKAPMTVAPTLNRTSPEETVSPPSRPTREAPADQPLPLAAETFPGEKIQTSGPAQKIGEADAPLAGGASTLAAAPAVGQPARLVKNVSPANAGGGEVAGATSARLLAALPPAGGSAAGKAFGSGFARPAAVGTGGSGVVVLPADKIGGGEPTDSSKALQTSGKTRQAEAPELFGGGVAVGADDGWGKIESQLIGISVNEPGLGELHHGAQPSVIRDGWRSAAGLAADPSAGGNNPSDGGFPGSAFQRTAAGNKFGGRKTSPLPGEPNGNFGKTAAFSTTKNDVAKGVRNDKTAPRLADGGRLAEEWTNKAGLKDSWRNSVFGSAGDGTDSISHAPAPAAPWRYVSRSDLTELFTGRDAQKAADQRRAGSPTRRPSGGESSAKLEFTIGLASHSGDWDSSPNALRNLAVSYVETTQIPEARWKVKHGIRLDDVSALRACRMVLITSNQPIQFTKPELAGMRTYVETGGLLWVNDSSADDNEEFDAAFRNALDRIWPGERHLVKITDHHPLFNGNDGRGFDFYNDGRKEGYRGWFPPPGDKYRKDYVEGVATRSGRLGLLYTRNDYPDGMAVDPKNFTPEFAGGMRSLTNLSQHEMRASSILMSINILAYALGEQAPRLPKIALLEAEYERLNLYRGPPLPVFDDFTAIIVAPKTENEKTEQKESVWKVENEGNPATLARLEENDERSLLVRLAGGPLPKTFVGRFFEQPLNLQGVRAVVLDAYSDVPRSVQIALLFQTRPQWDGYETRPLFLRPGWNRNLLFPLDRGDFKSNRNAWKNHDVNFEIRQDVGSLKILIYHENATGNVRLTNMRLQPNDKKQ